MPAYQIPTYKIDEAPAQGLYMQADDLDQDMADALAALDELEVALVPALPGFIMKGRRMGGGIEFTVAKVWTDPDGETNEMQVCTTLLALRDADAAEITSAALGKASTSAVPVHPEWEEAMNGAPVAPFTAIVPHRDLLLGAHEGKIAIEEIEACTGFAQFMVGHLLKAGEVAEPFDLSEIGLSATDGKIGAQDLAIAIQTGGLRGNVLIVEPGEDEFPQIYAYIGDAELDVIRVDFNVDETITIDSEGMKYLTFDADTLDLLEELRREAAEVWRHACDLLDEHDEVLLAAEGTEKEIELDDPLTHLYTNHAPIQIPEGIADQIKDHLGVAQRYNAES